ncbi:TonB-dependent receptor plug domain-containing protein [Polaribacter sp.]|nr:TonB-dependent receptor plug domain-containing protein [Polaribacter sp.]MDB0025706.1 TonB-dependent receptor plug domain-containing protein [Polaribacter sp.]MDB4167032.1 TonB-dependent receptor plug domain-containing protein [Polaribacter sp.]MDB9777257.1 TonB-dependent receptor plug domain-containing protein [Polaribacter sp.]MDB9887745.1 TonB-dependent receptor plug domain-containing protein [Polaribacter sp.]
MKKQILFVGVLACSFASTNLFAQKNETQKEKKEKVETLDEVVVTATKFETNTKNVGKIIYKITQETIKNNAGKTVLDLLNDVPGVEINGNFSTKGQNLGYYIRGGRNRQVAILINGVSVNDPSSFSGDFDLRQIDISQIESIEVLKGASSTLYGTGAATGVINILLKKASKKEFAATFNSSVGTNTSSEDSRFAGDTYATSLNMNGTLENVDYLLALSGNSSNGLSAAESSTGALFEEDAFTRKNVLLNLNFHLNNKLKIGVFTSYNQFSTDFDGTNYDPVTYEGTPADRDNTLKSVQKRFGVHADYKYAKGMLKVRTFFTGIQRNETPSEDYFKGEVYGLDVFNNYKINKEYSFLVGFTAQSQDMQQQTAYSAIEKGSGKQHFYDPYVSFNYNSNFGFHLNAGTRLNIHSEYDQNLVFNINPSYNFRFLKNDAKIFASYSTAFVTPTLSEIFTKLPTIDALLPEEDVTIEGGFEVRFSKKMALNTTYFYREETNKIGYDPISYQTINDFGTFSAKGVETEITFKATDKIDLSANYTFIDRDESLLLKIPQNKFFVKADYHLYASTFTSLSYRFVDATKDFGNVALPSYNLVDFFVNQSLLDDTVTFYGSVTNLFNEDFQEIAGYTTRGRNYKIGVRLQF